VIIHERMRSQQPVRSGYRPLLRLAGAGELYGMVEVMFVADEWVEPGGGALARIGLAAPEVLPVLEAGDEFEVLEGLRVVERGRVIDPPTITR